MSPNSAVIWSIGKFNINHKYSVPGNPRDVVFIRNGSVTIESVAGSSQLAFYTVNSSTSYTLTSTLSAPNTPYTLYRVNDTFLYVATMTAPVHRFIPLHTIV